MFVSGVIARGARDVPNERPDFKVEYGLLYMTDCFFGCGQANFDINNTLVFKNKLHRNYLIQRFMPFVL